MRKKMSENWKMTKAKLFDEMGLQAVSRESPSFLLDAPTILIMLRLAQDTSTSNSLAGGSRLGAGSIFGLGLGSSMTTYGGNRSTSANGASSSSDVTAEIQSRMMAYDEVIKRLNARRKTKTPFAVITYMNARMAKGSGEKQVLLSACLDVLAEVAGEGGATDAGEFIAGPVVERQHANAYLAAEGTDAKARSNRMIADASRRYLEGSFRRMVEKTLLDRQAEAKLGGSPSPINKMRAYSELVLRDSAGKQRLEEINKQYFWAQLYYLLRAGHIDEAVTLAEDVEYAMPRNDKAFVAWFRQWRQGDLRLPRDQRDRFVAEFNKRIRNTAEKGDPFRYAVWKIVGRAELSKKTVVGVTDTLEDWMWMQLHLVKEPVQGTIEAASDKYTLNDLGANVTKYGEAHFDPKGLRPLLYLQFLLLAGQFERGVEFLLSKARHEVDGVHLAIVLTYYGLLRLVSSSSSGVASSAPSPVVDFPRIIQRYIRSFYKSDAAAALQYAYLISLNSGLPAPTGPQQQEQCWDTVCNIILESRSYSLVLGQRTSEGQVLPSTVGRDMELVHVADKPAALKDLIRRVSARAPADMPLSDRIELYRATGESDSILRTLGQALSDSLEVPPQVNGSSSQQEGPDELVEYVRKMMLELETDRVTIDRKSVMTIDVLIALKDAKRKYDRGDFEATLETIRQINILPLDADVTGITRAADNFRDVDETISRRIDGVLLMAMRCLFEEHQKQKKSTHGGAGRLEVSDQ